MNLEKYITEAISSRRNTLTTEFPIVPYRDSVEKWLDYNGYDRIVNSVETLDLIKSNSKGYYYMPDIGKAKDTTMCILNGDGDNEYRLFFDPRKGYRLTSIALVKEISGRLDLFNIRCDGYEIGNLEDWLEKGAGITEAISSKKNSTQDTYDWGGIGWDWDCMDFKTVLEQAGYTEVEYTGKLSSMFSGRHKEYAVREKIMYGADDIFISNENDKKIYILGFSPKTIKLTTITEFSNGKYHDNMDIPDLRDYLIYG